MSSALAIAGVTAVLQDLLNDGLINHNVSGVLGSTVTVRALPPDRLEPANGTESTQLNLFLHRVTPNSGWRNQGLPSRDGSGQNRLTNPPLALDLHYLLSAYGSEDLQAEILLGYAMQLLHETPVLDRKAIATALNPSPSVGDHSSTCTTGIGGLRACGPGGANQDRAGSSEHGRILQALDSGAVPLPAYRHVPGDRSID